MYNKMKSTWPASSLFGPAEVQLREDVCQQLRRNRHLVSVMESLATRCNVKIISFEHPVNKILKWKMTADVFEALLTFQALLAQSPDMARLRPSEDVYVETAPVSDPPAILPTILPSQGSFKHICPHCSFKTNRPSHLEKHLQIHQTKKDLLRCSLCDFRCVRQSDLGKHQLLHADVVYTCPRPNCKFKTFHEFYLKKHEKYGHQEKAILSCDQCHFESKEVKLLKQHRRKCHPVMKKEEAKTSLKKSLQCDRCHYATPKSANLKRHITTVHAKEKTHLCNVCGTGYKRRDTLKQHLKVHTTLNEVDLSKDVADAVVIMYPEEANCDK